MAVPTDLTFRSFSVRIVADGNPLPVYGTEYDEATKTASGWIASTPGQKYTISSRMNDDVGSDVAIRTYLDGQDHSSAAISLRRQHMGLWISQTGKYTSATELRPFVFAELQTQDNPALRNMPLQLGTVAVRLSRVILGACTPGYLGGDVGAVPGYVDERAKKVGCHITQLGAAQPTVGIYHSASTPFSPADALPYVNFVFKHRSMAILRANGIVPRSASQEAQEDQDDDEVDAAEAQIVAMQAEVNARIDALAAKKRVKREELEASLASKRRNVKREDEIDVHRFFARGEVVDMTDL